jgi:hypothetical protein
MDFATTLSLISTLAIVGGVVFAAFQVREARRQREREAQLVLVRSFQTPEFTQAMQLILGLPDGLTKAQVDALVGDKVDLVFYWIATFGSLGILVYHHEISLELIAEFFSGPITVGWRKLHAYVVEVRRETQRETIGEWWEWLAGRLAAREATEPRVPAYRAHPDWRE